MSNISFLYKLFIYQIILKENIITSINHHPIKVNNILCPWGATKTLNNFGNIACRHHRTKFENCTNGKINNSIDRKCKLVGNPPIAHQKNVYLDKCPRHDQQYHFYPYDARKYIQCHKGRLLVLYCRPYEMFNVQQRRCMPETEISEKEHVHLPVSPANRNQSNVSVLNNDIIYCNLSLFGLFPHPFSNAEYLKCVEGRLYDKYCAPGFVFDFMSKLCVKNKTNLFQILPPVQDRYMNKSVIETRIVDNLNFLKCPNGLNGTFIDPFSCFNYISCSPAGTKINTCSSGRFYSFRKNMCELQSQTDEYDHVPCIESNGANDEKETIWLGVSCAPTGSRNYPHPRNQYKYINCNNGQLQVKRCPRNEIFSFDALECITMTMDEENNGK